MLQWRRLPVPVYDELNDFFVAPVTLNICKDLGAIDVLQLLLLLYIWFRKGSFTNQEG